jgi:AcrR family transcriptional regulator
MEMIQDMESIQNTTPSRTQRRAEKMRTAILDAAQELIAREGVDGLSCELVAAAADVSIQTVYNRVGRKDDLLMALAERALEENHRYLDDAYARRGPVRERMAAIGEGYFRFAFEQPDAFLFLAQPPARVATARVVELFRLQHAKLVDAIRAGQSEGVIDPNLDAAACATALWAMWNGLLISALRSERHGLDQTQMAQTLTTAGVILERGLSASGETSTALDVADLYIATLKGMRSG